MSGETTDTVRSATDIATDAPQPAPGGGPLRAIADDPARGTGERALAEAIIAFMIRRQSQHAKPSGLTLDCQLSFAQLKLLFHLPVEDSVPLGRYAESVGITPAALTQALGPIESLGLVERTRSDVDRRIVEARLTARGHEVLGTVREQFQERWALAMEGVDDERFAIAADVLGRVSGMFAQASSASHAAASSDA